MSVTTVPGKSIAGAATPAVKRPTLSIATVLALCFGLLIAVGISTVLFIGFSTSQKNTFGLLNDKATMTIQLIKNGVSSHLNPAAEKARFIERQVAAGIVDPTDRDQMEDVLTGMLAAAPQITGVALISPDFKQMLATLQPDGRAIVEYGTVKDVPEAQSLSEEIKNADEAFWGPLFFDEEHGITLVNILQPLRYQGRYLGFVGVVVSMPDLSRFIQDVGDQVEATAFILYGRDQVLAHPTLIERHPDLNRQSPTVQLSRIDDAVLANLKFSERVDGFESAANEGTIVDYLQIDGTGYVLFKGRMTDFGRRPWIVGAYMLEEDVDTELERLFFSGIAGIVVLIASILAAIFIGKRLARPIKRMARSATQVSNFELAAVEPLPPSTIRELSDQATAFNSMLSGLKWFETYVPRKLVQHLIADGDRLHSEERELTIMFTDIVGYSSISETMSATEAAQLLNDHFALLGACVEAEGGTIDKYVGDALMAFWGAPDEQPDHAERACRTAQAIAEAVRLDNEARRASGRIEVRIRIGVHTGPVLIGNIGAPGRINYTIVGDTVNAAERLEALGKELDEGEDVTILTSAETVSEIEQADFAIEPVGPFEVKGKKAKLDVFRLKSGSRLN